jgi:hypothetical protein
LSHTFNPLNGPATLKVHVFALPGGALQRAKLVGKRSVGGPVRFKKPVGDRALDKTTQVSDQLLL